MLSTAGFPQLSLHERDRRFSSVRRQMDIAGVEAIVARMDSSKWDSGCAIARYLSHIGGNGEEGYVVFSMREDPTFLIWGAAHRDNWLQCQDWTTDIRPCGSSSARSIATRLKELGLETGRIGLIGVAGGHLDRGEGRWPHRSYKRLRDELGQATFVDFDRELIDLMTIKSDEEIACQEYAMTIVEKAASTMLTCARPGARALDVFGRMMGDMVAAGGEPPSMVLFGANPQATIANRITPNRTLSPGDVVLTEITAKYTGYFAQAHVPLAVGRVSDHYQRMFEVVLAAYSRGQQVLKPGISAYELAQAMREPIVQAGMHVAAFPLFKGIGVALAEMPVSPPVDADPSPEAHPVIRENMVLTFEPGVYDAARRIGMNVAETLVVTRDGNRRLGKRNLQFSRV